MTIRKSLAAAFIILFNVSFAQNTESNLDSVSAQLISNIRLQQTEQSFIVTDKSLYKTGENVWLRVFLLRSASQKMSRASKNLFIDLVNEKDSVFSILLLDVKTGVLSAKLYLEPSMPSGFYWIRAYTRFMAEVETDKMVVYPIYVVNGGTINDNGSRVVRKGNYNPDNLFMQLFPEGGTLMTGAKSTVAFHIVDGKKDPVAISGYIKDNRDSTITSFASDNYGLGKFEILPSRSRQYKAQLQWNGKEMTYPLPPYNFFAGQISVMSDNNGQRKIRVLLEDSVYKEYLQTYLVGVAKDSLVFASVGIGMYELLVPAEKFPEGVTTFYLFDEDLRLLSERSVYFKDNLAIKAALDKNVYKKRDRANLGISITDVDGRPIPASLSVAIVDSSLTQPPGDFNIVSDYFENNDQCASSNWSLANTEELTDRQLDILMMARTRSYQDIMFRTNRPAFYSDSDSLLYIRGNAFYSKEKPAANRIATLLSKMANLAYDVDTTSDNGRFVFPLEQYPDSTRFIIQVSTAGGAVERADIVLDKLDFPKVKIDLQKEKFKLTPVAINNYLSVYADTISGIRGVELEAVTVKGYKKKELNYDPARRVSPDSRILTSDDIGKGSNSMSNAILRVPGIQLINGFVVANGLAKLSAPDASTEPLVFLDGAQVFLGDGGGVSTVSPVLSYLDMLHPNDISFIEVLTGSQGSAYGLRGGHGVILVNSKKSVDDPGSNAPNTYVVRGYHTSPGFMMPDYSNSKMKAAKFDDIRSTLYWNPSALTDEKGRIDISFFTSDIIANYKVIITGITARGDVVNRTISFRTE